MKHQPPRLQPWPPGPGQLGHEGMPATPQAAASPAPDWRCIARPAGAPPVPAAAPAAAGASVLDALLATLGGDEGGPSARSNHSLALQPLAVQPVADLPPPPPPHRSPPGAPRRHSRPLPPPPEVPPVILAALHTAATRAAAASPFASCAAQDPWADTANSNWGAGGGKADVHPALLQAFAWLDSCQPDIADEMA